MTLGTVAAVGLSVQVELWCDTDQRIIEYVMSEEYLVFALRLVGRHEQVDYIPDRLRAFRYLVHLAL